MDTDNNHPTPSFPGVPGLEITELIAQGAHGSVYCARQENHDRFVALKVLDTRFVDETAQRRFDRERVALGRISDHPAIVTLIDSGYTEAGLPYFILELAPGGTLAECIDADGAMNLDEATAMVINLAAAMECSHRAGIVHRDIKPANILRSSYGDWLLTDFGIASLTDGAKTETVEASYAHAAPEIFDGGMPGPAGDVYSMASVLATALTGNEPLAVQDGESPVSAMRRVVSEPYPDLRRAQIPDDLAQLLEISLSKEPTVRPKSAMAFAAALNEIRLRHDLDVVPVRAGHADDGATVQATEEELQALTTPGWDQAGPSRAGAESDGPGRLLKLAAVCAFVFAIFGVAFGGVANVDSDDVQDLAAEVIQVVADNDDAPDNDNGNDAANGNDNDGTNDGDGPRNGNGNGNRRGNGPGNGGGNGPGNGNGNGPGNGNGGGN